MVRQRSELCKSCEKVLRPGRIEAALFAQFTVPSLLNLGLSVYIRPIRYLGSSKAAVTGYPDRGPFTDVLCPTKSTGPLGAYCGGGAGVGSYVFMLNDPAVNECMLQGKDRMQSGTEVKSSQKLPLRFAAQISA
jgi:hypothetical protein